MNTAALQNSKHNTAETVISARSLSQVFTTRAAGKVVAVNSIDLTVKRGEIIALLGPNGAGKTTLIDMILGLTQPSGGELSVFGRSASEAARAGLLGAVQQTGGLLKDLTIRATVEMIAALYPKPINVDEVLAGADLTDIAKRKVGKCSGGQQQRLRYALATMHSPELLILDEPTAGMDVNARRTFWERMEAIAERGTTILFATHYLEEAQNFAQRILLMESGSIIADGSSDEIRALTGHRHLSFLAPAPITDLDVPVEVTEESGGYRHRISVLEIEQVLRTLLNNYSITDLEVIKPSLDESFTLLTEQAAASKATEA